MKTDARITIAAAGLWLPPRRESAADVGSTPQKAGYDSVAVSDDTAPPDMAVHAATTALDSAGWDGGRLDLLLHAWAYHQGHDYWSAPHYVADRLGAARALPIGIQQICNGGGAALQTAAAHLLADAGTSHALVTTADRFCAPGFDRWRGDLGVSYGDGASALLLCRTGTAETPRGLSLLAIASRAASQLEKMNRGQDDFSPAARSNGEQVDVRRTKKAYLREHGVAGFREIEQDSLRSVVTAALTEAGVPGDDPALRWCVLPRLRTDALESSYLPLLGDVTTAKMLDVGRTTGHLGAGDLPAGIAELMGRDLLEPGERALVLGTGSGFTWSCAVVERPMAAVAEEPA
ncbi:ketoacyl-ACP synthase III family protein [Streptomyces sp. NPDC050392]|uniref:ketoacyl-ACP synthase III family protein n=1 Tax=Streptomyces sp. NPDC050392 TaxID=3155782 RepID=UPI003443B964